MLQASQQVGRWQMASRNWNFLAETQDRSGDLEIFRLTLSRLSYRGKGIASARPHNK